MISYSTAAFGKSYLTFLDFSSYIHSKGAGGFVQDAVSFCKQLNCPFDTLNNRCVPVSQFVCVSAPGKLQAIWSNILPEEHSLK